MIILQKGDSYISLNPTEHEIFEMFKAVNAPEQLTIDLRQIYNDIVGARYRISTAGAHGNTNTGLLTINYSIYRRGPLSLGSVSCTLSDYSGFEYEPRITEDDLTQYYIGQLTEVLKTRNVKIK